MGLKLMAEIGLDGSGFERGLHHIGKEAAASVKNLAVEAFGIYGIEQAIAKTVETATELVNTSKRLDVTVEQLQLLRQAAKDGGTEMGTLASAFEKLDIARAKALGGDKEAIAAFAKLGVSQAQLTTQTAATIFTGSISNAAKSNNVESLAPALKEILGKGFGELIPVLKTDFEELGDKMHKLGSIMDTETAVKLKAVGDNFELLKNIMAAQLGPALLTLTEIILSIVGKIKSASAFWGGGTSNMTGKDWLEALTINPFKFFEKFDTKEATRQSQDADTEWKDMIDALRKKLEDEAKDLAHPKPIVPDISGESTAKPKAAHLASTQADALVRVGNFLGSAGNTISRVDQRKIDLLTKIEKNTQPQSSGGNFGWMSGIPSV